MQDPKKHHARKPWYQRAMDMATTWRAIPSPSHLPRPTRNSTTIWKTMTKGIITLPTTLIRNNMSANNNSPQRRLTKCSSLGVARVCLCAPISSYTETFPPRRSNSYPRSKSMSGSGAVVPSRTSVEGRRRAVFRGKSLTEDVLMRRFVVEEEAMMQVRRRDQMEVIRRKRRKRNPLGPSPLSRMVRAQDFQPMLTNVSCLV